MVGDTDIHRPAFAAFAHVRTSWMVDLTGGVVTLAFLLAESERP